MSKKLTTGLLLLTLLFMALVLSGCGKKVETSRQEQNSNITVEQNLNQNNEMYLGQQTNPEEQKKKLCGWIDESDIIIKLNFADGVVKDTSYETGFYFSPIYSHMKLARGGCDYRVGFKFSEFAGKGPAEVGVRGYNDNARRQLEGEPLKVIFNTEGKLNIGKYFEVMVKN